MAAHETILETMEEFLNTDLEQLLEEHCHLLFSDFVMLASGPTNNKQEWIAEIDSALGAATHVARGSKHETCSLDALLLRQASLDADGV